MAVTITLEQFSKTLRWGLLPSIRKAMREGLVQGAGIIARETKSVIAGEDLEYTGWLKGSVYHRAVLDGADVGVDAPHAKWLEYGTRPFTPPLEPLAIWATIKLGMDPRQAQQLAYLIQQKYRKEGIKPRHFFRRSVINALPAVKDRVERKVMQAEKRLFRSVGRAVLG